MSDPFLGEIRMVGFNFAPSGWALCNGQVLSISQNSALFALLGTIYGGNGTTNFQLPNLQGRVPIHAGNGAGLSPYVQGQAGGTESVTLIAQHLPSHSHPTAVSNGPANASSPVNAVPAVTDGGNAYSTAAPNAQMSAASSALVGGNQPHSNIQPYLAVNFIIALQGIFPSRN